MTHFIPRSRSARGACSRELPQPKLGPVTTKIFGHRYGSLLSTESGLSVPSLLKRSSTKNVDLRPVRLIVLRNYLGMIASILRSNNLLARLCPSTLLNLGKLSVDLGILPFARVSLSSGKSSRRSISSSVLISVGQDLKYSSR